MKTVVILLAGLAFAGTSASAEYMAGLAVDSSSNMLLRINGVSGTITSMYGSAGLRSGRASCSYGFDGGVLEHYDGIQFHHHSAVASYTVISRNTLFFDTGVEYDLARYGDVTVLTGYEQYGFSARVKAYLTPSLLLRSESSVGGRSYRTFGSESYTDAVSYVRLDRFFNSGTTLRGQIDLGIRHYPDAPGTPDTSLLGSRLRVAQSLGERWGMFVETQAQAINSTQKEVRTNNSSNTYIPDYNRIFLDDIYKYSMYGFMFNTKYLINRSGNIQFESKAMKKTYDSSISSSYWYLPPEGWDEWEWSLNCVIAYRPGFFPAFVHPLCEVYHVEVDASLDSLSYDSTGISIRFELY
ncbi:hypothetical protein LLG96_18855 [bacterium]|nr:hypothetical protein [bacterium]